MIVTPLRAAQARLDAVPAQVAMAQAALDRSLLQSAAVLAFNVALVAGPFVHESGHARVIALRIHLAGLRADDPAGA